MLKILISLGLFLFLVVPVGAQSRVATRSAVMEDALVATAEAEATMSGQTQQRPERVDLTQPEKSKSRLERLLDDNPVTGSVVPNFLKIAIREAVNQGVPPNTIVLLILFPLVAALIAAARHIVGLQGFGIFTPAVISVAFLATGVTVGMLLFVAIMLTATVGRVVMRKLHIPSLPRMALLLWFVSLGVLALVLSSPWLRLEALEIVSIFPILLLVLLAETFIEVQVTQSFRAALRMTVETFILALLSFLVLSTQTLQGWVLLNPELSILGIALIDILIGKYTGLRLLERYRFRKLLKN